MGGSHGCDDCVAEVSHISLCAGYGGIDIGLGAVVEGLRTVAYVEIEAFAVANLAAKMEAGCLDAAPIYTDLHAFPFGQFHGCVDILTGGFPCQPFSKSGRRMAEDDPRHLWPAIARGIKACRPTVVFMENVEGIVTAKSSEGHTVLHHVLVELEGLGYRATAGIFSAEECGAPHQRRRAFIAGLADTGRGHGDKLHTERQRAAHGEIVGSNGPQWTASIRAESETSMWTMAERSEDGDSCDGCTLGWCPRSRQCIEDCDQCEAADLEHRAGEDCGIWPARAGQPQHDWEPPRVVSSMGGDPNGPAPELDRIDRLRMLGNGVVPATAARAFSVLMGRLLLGMLLWPRIWILLAPDALEAVAARLA